MRALLQRVTQARVDVGSECVGRIDHPGLLALVGVTHGDSAFQAATVARRIAELRILADEQSVLDRGAPVLLVSQFTLYGDTRWGRRPSWTAAAPAAVAEPLVERVTAELRARGVQVATGCFGADMQITLTADGPFTVTLDTDRT